jgi:hypothetical protein
MRNSMSDGKNHEKTKSHLDLAAFKMWKMYWVNLQVGSLFSQARRDEIQRHNEEVKQKREILKAVTEAALSPSRRREAPCEDTNPPPYPPSWLFTPGETKALAFVHQWSRAWVTNGVGYVLGGWSSSLISNIWRTVMNSGHWLVQFKACLITTAWRQRNSKHLLIWWFG